MLDSPSLFTQNYSPFVSYDEHEQKEQRCDDVSSVFSHESILEGVADFFSVFFDAAAFRSAAIKPYDEDEDEEIASITLASSSHGRGINQVSSVGSSFSTDGRLVESRLGGSLDRGDRGGMETCRDRSLSSPIPPSTPEAFYGRVDSPRRITQRPVAHAVIDTLCDAEGRKVIITSQRPLHALKLRGGSKSSSSLYSLGNSCDGSWVSLSRSMSDTRPVSD